MTAFQEVQLFLGNVPSLMNSFPQKLSNPSFRLRFAFKGDLKQCSSCWFWIQLKIVKKSWHTITSSCLLSPAQMTFPRNHALTMIAIVFMKNPWISYFSSWKKKIGEIRRTTLKIGLGIMEGFYWNQGRSPVGIHCNVEKDFLIFCLRFFPEKFMSFSS